MPHILLTRRETALDRPTVSAHQDYAAATLAMLEEICSVGSEGDPDESATLRVLTRDHRASTTLRPSPSTNSPPTAMPIVLWAL